MEILHFCVEDARLKPAATKPLRDGLEIGEVVWVALECGFEIWKRGLLEPGC